MRKEMILNKEDFNQVNKPVSMSYVLSPVLYIIDMLAKYFSYVMQEKFTRRSTALLLNVQVAFTAVVFPADFSLLLRALFVVWFVVGIRLFRRYK